MKGTETLSLPESLSVKERVFLPHLREDLRTAGM